MLAPIFMVICYAVLVVLFAMLILTFPKILLVDAKEDIPTFIISLASMIWPITLILVISMWPFKALSNLIDRIR